MNPKQPKIEYFDIQKNWRNLRPHVESDEAQDILVRDFNMFTFGRWKIKFKKGMLPTDFELCDWQEHHRGPRPEYWQYTKYSACHWLVNFNLIVALRTIPHKQWRILTSEEHSTVWDGKGLLFDFNLQAMGVPAEESFALANEEELRPGQQLEVDFANHWRDELGA